MAALRAVELVRRYAGRVVLDHVSLALDAKDAVLVRGRSGSGKSTLLHLLAGIEVPDGGRVELAGQDLAALDAAARSRHRLLHVGLVFQHFNLIPDLTAEENVRVPLQLARRDGAKARAAELLERLDLAPLARRFPASMSGGELQRVAIARALANDPAVILADEPTANLDEANARLVLELLRGLAAEGRAVVVASHDPLALDSFPVRRQLREGQLVALASPAEP